MGDLGVRGGQLLDAGHARAPPGLRRSGAATRTRRGPARRGARRSRRPVRRAPRAGTTPPPSGPRTRTRTPARRCHAVEVALEAFDRGCPPTAPGPRARATRARPGRRRTGGRGRRRRDRGRGARPRARGSPRGARRRTRPSARTPRARSGTRVRARGGERAAAARPLRRRRGRPRCARRGRRTSRSNRRRRSPARDELALDPLDVRPVRHDQRRIAVERVQVALEQQRHLARVRGADEQPQTHSRPIVVSGPDGSGRASAQTAAKTEGGQSPPSFRSRPRPTSAGGRAWPPAGPASFRRRRRRDPPAWSRGVRR